MALHHLFKREVVYSFQCGKCKRWWEMKEQHLKGSPNLPVDLRRYVWCPYCNHSARALLNLSYE
jgi:hypothetical protein